MTAAESAPEIPFSQREQALRWYEAVAGMWRGDVPGDMVAVIAARLEVVAAAERAVARAKNGPPRAFLREVDDESLERMSSAIAERRAELEQRRAELAER